MARGKRTGAADSATDAPRQGDPAEKNPRSGTLSFFLEKRYYELQLDAFGDIYGFPRHSTVEIEKFRHCRDLWSIIAGGHYTPRGAKISHIRNPVIRFAAKIISNTLFFKAEPGAVREDEMTLIYHAIRHLVPEIEVDGSYDICLGAVLAELLEGVKSSAFRSRKANVIYCGTILTPLFIYIGIDLSRAERDDMMSSIDHAHLRNCRIMTDNNTYSFYDHEMINREIILPLVSHSSLISRDNLEFYPGALGGNLAPRRSVQERQRRTTASTRPRRSAHVPRTDYREGAEEEVHEQAPEQQPSADFDPYTYTLPPTPPRGDPDATREWMVQATQRHHSMMQRFISTITMGCAGPSHRRTRSPAAWERTTGRPDQVADDTQSPDQ